MDLRQLRYFVAVAEEGSITRAAARLGLQQPPLSQQIQHIEAELGVRLFDRESRRVQVNAAGRVFLAGARKAISAAQDAVDALRRFELGEEGRIVVGFTSSASFHPLTPMLLRSFRTALPQVAMEVEENGAFDLLMGLEKGHIDVAFVRVSAASRPELVSHTLVEEPILVALPSDHALAVGSEPLSFRELGGVPVVRYRRREGSGIFDNLSAKFYTAGYTPLIIDDVVGIIAALNLVAAGRGVTFVPASMRLIHSELVSYRPMEPSLPPLGLSVVYRPDNDVPAVHAFIEAARASAAILSNPNLRPVARA